MPSTLIHYRLIFSCQSRLNDFVKGNVESMLVQRQLTERAGGAQGERGSHQ